MRSERAAGCVQLAWRAWACRRDYLDARAAICRLQAQVKGWTEEGRRVGGCLAGAFGSPAPSPNPYPDLLDPLGPLMV